MKTSCYIGPLLGVILAGGQSRRMGSNKALINLQGRSLVAHAIKKLLPQVDMAILSANTDATQLAKFGLPVVADLVPGFSGPLAGILTGMLWARENLADCHYIVTVASDTPFFPSDLSTCLSSKADTAQPIIVLAQSLGRIHPVFGLWPVALADKLQMALESGFRKTGAWAEETGAKSYCFDVVKMGPNLVDPFFNINTPEDLAKSETLISDTSFTT